MSTDSYRFTVGALDCLAIKDGSVSYPAGMFFANAPPDRLDKVLREHQLQPQGLMIPYICLLIGDGRHRVLVDTGAGTGGAGSGRLKRILRAQGIEPTDIDTVILSHGHADHIGGTTDGAGTPAFPCARYVMWKDEWAMWTSEAALAQLEAKGLLVAPARINLPPLTGRLDLIDDETEIVPHIHAIAAPGHTPGHLALAITSGREQMVYSADTVIHPLHLEQPDWHWTYDLLPDQAATTKRRLFDRAAAEHALVVASHFPFPGVGHVVRHGAGWRWHPVATLE